MLKFSPMLKAQPFQMLLTAWQWETVLPFIPLAVSILTSLILLVLSKKRTSLASILKFFSISFPNLFKSVSETISEHFLNSSSPSDLPSLKSSSDLSQATQFQQETEVLQMNNTPCPFYNCAFYNPDSPTHCNECRCVFNLIEQTEVDNNEKHE